MADNSGERRHTIGLDDFSQKAVRKAVTSRGLQSPGFLYPSAIGILSLAAMTVAGVTPVWLALGAGCLAAGAGMLGVQLGLRREKLARDYLARLHEQLNAKRHSMIADLTNLMHQLHFPQGISQLEQLQGKFKNFVDILNRALDREEITYGRYLGIAEQVYLSSLDNLERVTGALASVQTIDPRHIESRIRDIHADGVVTETEATEQEALNQRKTLREGQLQKVEELLAQNEQAMTQLDLTAAALAEMKTRAGQATMDMETAMTELQSLVAKASHYNRQN